MTRRWQARGGVRWHQAWGLLCTESLASTHRSRSSSHGRRSSGLLTHSRSLQYKHHTHAQLRAASQDPCDSGMIRLKCVRQLLPRPDDANPRGPNTIDEGPRTIDLGPTFGNCLERAPSRMRFSTAGAGSSGTTAARWTSNRSGWSRTKVKTWAFESVRDHRAPTAAAFAGITLPVIKRGSPACSQRHCPLLQATIPVSPALVGRFIEPMQHVLGSNAQISAFIDRRVRTVGLKLFED
jgi:hypothetical protein